jgi:hypothetical protein
MTNAKQCAAELIKLAREQLIDYVSDPFPAVFNLNAVAVAIDNGL